MIIGLQKLIDKLDNIQKKYNLPMQNSKYGRILSREWAYNQIQILETYLSQFSNNTIIDNVILEKYDCIKTIINYLNEVEQLRIAEDKGKSKKKHGYTICSIFASIIPQYGETIEKAKRRLHFAFHYESLYSDSSRLVAVILLYLLDRGSCQLSYPELIEELEKIEDSRRNYFFYMAKSKEVIIKTLKKAIKKLATIVTIEEDGHKINYFADNNKFKNLTRRDKTDIYDLFLLDAIFKYKGCDGNVKRKFSYCVMSAIDIINDHTLFIENVKTKTANKFNYDTLKKLTLLISLFDSPIKFKYNNKEVYFQISLFSECNDKYYIIGTDLSDRNKKITTDNIFTHYEIEKITEISKSKKKFFSLYEWCLINTNWFVDFTTLENDEIQQSNVKIDNYIRLVEKVNNYVYQHILKYRNVCFKVNTNTTTLTQEDIESQFKIRNFAPSKKIYTIECNEEYFIEWALPRYSELEILDKDIRKIIEEKIKELNNSLITNLEVISFSLLELGENKNPITAEDVKNQFGSLIINSKGNTFNIKYNKDLFITWALPKYNYLDIHDIEICKTIEEQIQNLTLFIRNRNK